MERSKFKRYFGILLLIELPIIGWLTEWSVCIGLIIFFVPFFVLILTYVLTNKNKVNYKGHYNNLEDMYTPAIASYMLNDNVGKEDIIATILDLSIRKYLKIEKSDNCFKIELLKKEFNRLYFHEDYIVYCIQEKQKIDLQKFKRNIIKDCEYNKLIYKKKSLALDIALKAIGILEIIGVILLFPALGAPVLAVFGFVPISIAYIAKLFVKTHNKRAKGTELEIKSRMLKNYLRDYTLLKEKRIDYTTVAERYVAYALALEEADKIENIISENKKISEFIVDNSLFSTIINYK